MRYEIYKKLTPEQKEEYNYRFKDNKLDLSYSFLYSLLIFLTSGLLLLIIYINVEIIGQEFTEQLSHIFNIIKTAALITYVWAAHVIIESIFFIYKKHQEKKWMKQNNIKTNFQQYIDKIYRKNRK